MPEGDGLTYQAVRDSLLASQPVQLADYAERRREQQRARAAAATSEPQPRAARSDTVVNGFTRDGFDVPDATKVSEAPAVTRPGRQSRKEYCWACDKKHLPDWEGCVRDALAAGRPAAPKVRTRQRPKRPRKQRWQTQGLAGRFSTDEPDPRVQRD